MEDTVKLRLVGTALVMGIPTRLRTALGLEPGDYVTLKSNGGRLYAQKEGRKRNGKSKRSKKAR